MEGVLVGSIPFTHPAHVPQILVFLRQQALFNTLISSCVRPMARQDSEHTTIFEVSALSWQCISVSLEHPFEETLATAELDLSDISAVKCKLYGVSITNTEQTSDLAGKVLQRCLSIPLTMRTLIKAWEGRTFMLNPISGGGNNSFNNNLGTGREPNNHNGSNVPEFGNEDIIIKQEPGVGMNGTGSTGRQQQQQPPTQQQQPQQNQQQNQQQQQSFLDAGAENSIGFPSFSGSSDTPPAAMLNPLQLGALSTTPTPSGTDGKRSKSRKRKTADGSWKSPKRKNDPDSNEILLESSSSDSTPLGTPTGGKDVLNDTRTPTPTSAASITSGGLDLSNLDPLDILSTDKSSDYDLDNDAEIMQVEPTVASLEEALKRERKLKKRAEEKPSSTNVFEDNKTLVSPSVSITPITSGSSNQSASYNSMLTSIGLDRRPGIEIIPITSLPQPPLPNSITITAINNPAKLSSSSSPSSSSPSTSGTAQGLGDERSKERKSSKNRSSSSSIEDKNKLEKKRKRKRESSPMGPPEKLPLKQVSSNIDPLSKPVSVSIKPASESPPASSSSRPSSPATTLRKFSPSPTRGNPLVLVGKSSPTSLKQSSSSSTSSSGGSTGGNGTGGGSGSKPVPSPKHSPVYSSPKHMSSMPSSSVSPKHGTSSPKHGNSGSAGKPSMSALKSAANSPSGKSSDGSGVSSKTKISSLQSTSPSSSAITLSTLSSSTSSSASSSQGSKEPRDKEARKTSSLMFGSSGGSSSGHQSPKSKSISSKPKPIDSELQQASLSSGSGGSTPPSDPSKSALTSTQQQQQQARNRKGSLSAVIDKLKNAQHCTDDAASSSGSNLAPSSTTGGSSSSSSTSNPASKNPSDAKNPTEYMVKPSSDGMKLTINKTRTKDLKSNNSGLKLSSVALGGTSGSAGGITITPVTTPGNVSPKLFSGLKTGVISGPASRKPQAQTSPKVLLYFHSLRVSLNESYKNDGWMIPFNC